MNTIDRHTEQRLRHKRWLIIALVIIAALTMYGAGLGWVANQLADDLSATIKPLPVVDDNQHRAD